MTALRNSQPDAFDIRLRIIDANEEKLNVEAGSLGTRQNIYLARMRHHCLEAEAASGLDAGFTATIGDSLRLPYTIVVGALKLARYVIGIDVFAEFNTRLTKCPGKGSFSRSIRPGNDQ